MKKQSFGKVLGSFWRDGLFYAGVICVVVIVLWWRLGNLVPGFSASEEVARYTSRSLQNLIDNPIFLPHRIIQYAFIRTGHSSPFWMRSASAIWGAAIVAVFYDIIHTWYSRRIALISGFLLLTSAWFLHFARIGTPFIMFGTSIGLLWIGMKLKSVAAPRVRTSIASTIILISCLYVPGLVWLVVPMLVWQRKVILHEFGRLPRWLSFGFLSVIGVALAPLVYGLAMAPKLLIPNWLLIPTNLNLRLFWSNAWHLPIWFIFKGPTIHTYWLGHVPMLDSFSLVMIVLGTFVLAHYQKLDRVRAIAIIIAITCGLAILNGWGTLVMMLPILFVVIAAGLALFLQQWFTVFPTNPVARAIGVGLLTFVVALVSFYNYRSYFVAWPHNAETKQAFNSQLKL